MVSKPNLIWSKLAPGFCGVSLVCILGFTWAITEFGSLSQAWLYASGVRLLVKEPTVRLAEGKPGDDRQAEFVVYNLSSHPIQILGANISCGCVSADDKLPATVPARGIKALRLALHLEQTPSNMVDQTVTYHTDEPTAPNLAVKVSCRVNDP